MPISTAKVLAEHFVESQMFVIRPALRIFLYVFSSVIEGFYERKRILADFLSSYNAQLMQRVEDFDLTVLKSVYSCVDFINNVSSMNSKQ